MKTTEQQLVDLCFKLGDAKHVARMLRDTGFPTREGKLRPSNLVFKIGRFYEHSGGGKLHVLESFLTTMWGTTLIAEESGGGLRAVGSDTASAENYIEIDRERWLEDFNV